VTSVPTRIGKAAATRVGAGAAHVVSSLAPKGTLQSDNVDQISTAVVMTLLVIVLAVLLGVGSTYLPAIRARAWR
jgi:hypothetical protein